MTFVGTELPLFFPFGALSLFFGTHYIVIFPPSPPLLKDGYFSSCRFPDPFFQREASPLGGAFSKRKAPFINRRVVSFTMLCSSLLD